MRLTPHAGHPFQPIGESWIVAQVVPLRRDREIHQRRIGQIEGMVVFECESSVGCRRS